MTILTGRLSVRPVLLALGCFSHDTAAAAYRFLQGPFKDANLPTFDDKTVKFKVVILAKNRTKNW